MRRTISVFLAFMLLLLCLSGCAERKKETNTGDSSAALTDFANATLGVIDGSLYDGFSRELFPEAKIDSYQSFTDLFQCVK